MGFINKFGFASKISTNSDKPIQIQFSDNLSQKFMSQNWHVSHRLLNILSDDSTKSFQHSVSARQKYVSHSTTQILPKGSHKFVKRSFEILYHSVKQICTNFTAKFQAQKRLSKRQSFQKFYII